MRPRPPLQGPDFPSARTRAKTKRENDVRNESVRHSARRDSGRLALRQAHCRATTTAGPMMAIGVLVYRSRDPR